MKIEEITKIKKLERVASHSHIKGLGVRDNKIPFKCDGLVGQVNARKAAWIVVRMIKEGKMAGRGILLVGPSGSGKTALAVAIARELGKDTPFVDIDASEVYSAEMKKTEVLARVMRQAIGVKIKEKRKVYEGVVKKLDFSFTKNPFNPYQQIPRSVYIELETKDESRGLTGDQSIAYQVISQGIEEGDIIWIDVDTGKITKVGKCEKYSNFEKDIISSENLVPIPSGPVLKEKEFVYVLSLHELDLMKSRRESLFSIFFGEESKEISNEVRKEVDEMVREWIEEGKAEIIPGVLFIDDAHMLDIEVFSFLSRAMESEFSPIIILATNRGITKIKGTDVESPHGIPLDLLDRLLIIKVEPYKKEEILEILKIRAKEEKVNIEEEALKYLAEIGEKTSLRYSIQLLTPAHEIAKSKGKEKIDIEDLKEAMELFLDINKSIEYIKKFEEKFLK